LERLHLPSLAGCLDIGDCDCWTMKTLLRNDVTGRMRAEHLACRFELCGLSLIVKTWLSRLHFCSLSLLAKITPD
jgi:hypothetical protein